LGYKFSNYLGNEKVGMANLKWNLKKKLQMIAQRVESNQLQMIPHIVGPRKHISNTENTSLKSESFKKCLGMGNGK